MFGAEIVFCDCDFYVRDRDLVKLENINYTPTTVLVRLHPQVAMDWLSVYVIISLV